LFKAIRYAYLHHDQLVEISLNPDFAGAKDYILEGLSYRLNPYEQAKKPADQYKINVKPRKNYGPEMEKRLNENFANSRQQ
jgi:hypothetical protein